MVDDGMPVAAVGGVEADSELVGVRMGGVSVAVELGATTGGAVEDDRLAGIVQPKPGQRDG